MNLNYLKNKRILILGFGREGQDTFLFLRKMFPEKIIGIADRLEIKDLRLRIKDTKVKLHAGKDYLESLKDYNVIIKTPGIPIHLPEIEKAFKQRKITSQTEIFLQNCPGIIVGITGTKGKSTTTSLIYNILKAGSSYAQGFGGQGVSKIHLVGNIGVPVLHLLSSAKKDDVYVFEFSCHQLYGMKKSPRVAVFLNVYPEHLDYYKDFEEYAKSKSNITLHQTKNDFLIYNSKDKIVRKFAKKSKAQKIPIPMGYRLKRIVDKIKKNPLLGEFNLRNIATAFEVGKIFKIPEDKIIKAVENFKPLSHRLELVGTFKGITFYNDALSTIPETAIAAIDALGDNVETIFLGGFDRNIKFNNLARKVLKSKIKTAILFPTTGKKIAQALLSASRMQGKKMPNYFFADNMEDAVKLAYEHTGKGKIALLSCASTSFSIFRDYEEKGNLFKKFVKEYAQ